MHKKTIEELKKTQIKILELEEKMDYSNFSGQRVTKAKILILKKNKALKKFIKKL